MTTMPPLHERHRRTFPASPAFAAATTLVVLAATAAGGSMLAGDDPFGTLDRYQQPWFALPAWGWVAVGIVYYSAMAVVTYRLLRRLPVSRPVGSVLTIIVANEAWNALLFGFGALWLATAGLIVVAALVARAVRGVHAADVLSGRILLVYLVWLVGYDLPWMIALALGNTASVAT